MMSLIEKKCMGRKKSLNDQISTWLKRLLDFGQSRKCKSQYWSRIYPKFIDHKKARRPEVNLH